MVQHVLRHCQYERIVLIGFSMGGNLTLVYLGSRGRRTPRQLSGAVVFSVPCDLASSAEVLARKQSTLYMRNFLSSLHRKIQAKMKMMPGRISDHDFHRIKNFKDYDERYTAPLHGFNSAEDYWEKCSSLAFIPKIRIPTLVVNAEDDPFLSDECYPVEAVSENAYVLLETPPSGGHVGFIQFNKDRSYWSENRAMEFIGEINPLD